MLWFQRPTQDNSSNSMDDSRHSLSNSSIQHVMDFNVTAPTQQQQMGASSSSASSTTTFGPSSSSGSKSGRGAKSTCSSSSSRASTLSKEERIKLYSLDYDHTAPVVRPKRSNKKNKKACPQCHHDHSVASESDSMAYYSSASSSSLSTAVGAPSQRCLSRGTSVGSACTATSVSSHGSTARFKQAHALMYDSTAPCYTFYAKKQKKELQRLSRIQEQQLVQDISLDYNTPRGVAVANPTCNIMGKSLLQGSFDEQARVEAKNQ